MMIKDDADNREYVTLLSLIADNSGKFDICALIYDLCTGNKKTYLDEKTNEYVYESIQERMLDVKRISRSSYKDLKRIVNYIKDKYVCTDLSKLRETDMITFIEGDSEAIRVSVNFDDVFIKNTIEKYYHDELD